MKKILIGIFVIGILGFSIWLAAPQNKQAKVETPDNFGIFANEKNFDFGQIKIYGGNVFHNFTIKNTSNNPLTIGKIYTSCMCTTATLIKKDKTFGPYGMPGHGFIPAINEILAPGEEAVIKVEFDPAAHGPAGLGAISRDVFVFNEAGKQILKLNIKAQVIP